MKLIMILIFSCLSFAGNTQAILTLNGNDVDVDEFRRMYEKSAKDADYSAASVEEYLQLFINYQLKLAEAKAQGVESRPEVQQEINTYENQLIEGELDKELLSDLKKEAFSRLQEEICASHVLVHVKNDPAKIDVELALKKANKLRDRILAGEDFGYIAEKNSADMSTKYNDGSLGCFTTLQLSNYDLENAIFSLRKGQISEPIRTDLGFHIIKINDRRPTNGLVRAKQLFARSNKTQSDEQNAKAKLAIDAAYAELKAGEQFDAVGDNFMQNKAEIEVSRDDIDWFSVGSYEEEFENAIFDLRKKGDFSKPVKTSLGWHIFLLEGRKDLPNLEEMESALVEAIMKNERYFEAKLQFADRLKREYEFVKEVENVELFIDQVAPGIGIKGWQIPSIYNLSLPLFTIDDQEFPARNFVHYVQEEHRQNRYHSFSYYYNNFESDALLNHHKEVLIEEDDELKALLEEYKNGIILFALMEDNLWAGSPVSDSELRQFYTDNSSRYNKPDAVKVKQYAVSKRERKTIRKLERLLKDGKSDYYIEQLNEKQDNVISISELTIPKSEANIDGVNLFDISEYAERESGNEIQFLVGQEIIPGESKSFEATKQQVKVDYEQWKEAEWAKQLKQKHNLTVHEDVVDQLIR